LILASLIFDFCRSSYLSLKILSTLDPFLHTDRTVVGNPVEVTNALTTLTATGRVVGTTRPRRMPGNDPRVYVIVRLLDRPASLGPVRRRNRLAVVAAVVGTVLLTLAGLGYLAFVLLQAVVAALPAILGVLALAAGLLLLWYRLGRAGVCCPGLHCPGCRH
jgi:hypothetical protein